MSEETSDPKTPQLKRSLKLKAPETEKPSTPAQSLQLKRPPLEPAPTATAENKLRTEPGDSSPRTRDEADAPKKPLGGIVPEAKAGHPDRPPPERPSEPAPATAIDEGASPKPEKAIQQLSEPKKAHNIFVSLLVITLLLGLLGGSAYGLYYVLRPAPAVAPAPPQNKAARGNESDGLHSSSIAKAKVAIAKIPAGPEEEVTAQSEKAPAAELAEPESGRTESINRPLTETKTAAGEEAIASFLTSAHIGGLRTGDRPKVLLNGESYVPGDLVDARLGLHFSGIRKGKLAFKDEKGIIYLKSF